MDRLEHIRFADIFLIPNLLSLLRLLLVVPLGFYLVDDRPENILICAVIIIVAGFSDFFDGFLARRLNQRSRLGLYLDPLVDKIMALAVIIMLIFTRGFPVWLLLLVVIRDLAILIGARALAEKRGQIQQATLPGKYYFASLATLLGSYIINFDFGIRLFTVLVLIFYLWSSVSYGRMIYRVYYGKPAYRFNDKPAFRLFRIIATSAITAWTLYRLYCDVVKLYWG